MWNGKQRILRYSDPETQITENHVVILGFPREKLTISVRPNSASEQNEELIVGHNWRMAPNVSAYGAYKTCGFSSANFKDLRCNS